jgi:hypothetical protein
MCSAFRNFKKFIHLIHAFIHSFISSGDGQKARKSGRSPERHQSHPIIRIPEPVDSLYARFDLHSSVSNIISVSPIYTNNQTCQLAHSTPLCLKKHLHFVSVG